MPAASTDAFRTILARHRRRQTGVLGAGLAVVLIAGSVVGFAAGRSGRDHGATQVAASSPTATTVAGAVAPSATGATATAIASGGGFVNGASTPATQLLLRDAHDGSRVRLYETSLAASIACPVGAACAQPAIAPCQPTGFVTAEVSDDQVAGEAAGPVWQASGSAPPLDVVTASVVGGGEPQPIVVVVARAGSGVGTVTLETTYGSDTASPAAGWVALAVRLPADFAAADPSLPGGGLPAGTVTALSASGAQVSSTPLASLGQGMNAPACAGPPGIVCNGSSTASPPASPPSGALGATTVETAPAPCEVCSPVTTAPGPGLPTPTVVGPPTPVVPPSDGATTGGGASGSGGGATVGSGGASTVICSSVGGVASSGTGSGPATTIAP